MNPIRLKSLKRANVNCYGPEITVTNKECTPLFYLFNLNLPLSSKIALFCFCTTIRKYSDFRYDFWKHSFGLWKHSKSLKYT